MPDFLGVGPILLSRELFDGRLHGCRAALALAPARTYGKRRRGSDVRSFRKLSVLGGDVSDPSRRTPGIGAQRRTSTRLRFAEPAYWLLSGIHLH